VRVFVEEVPVTTVKYPKVKGNTTHIHDQPDSPYFWSVPRDFEPGHTAFFKFDGAFNCHEADVALLALSDHLRAEVLVDGTIGKSDKKAPYIAPLAQQGADYTSSAAHLLVSRIEQGQAELGDPEGVVSTPASYDQLDYLDRSLQRYHDLTPDVIRRLPDSPDGLRAIKRRFHEGIVAYNMHLEILGEVFVGYLEPPKVAVSPFHVAYRVQQTRARMDAEKIRSSRNSHK